LWWAWPLLIAYLGVVLFMNVRKRSFVVITLCTILGVVGLGAEGVWATFLVHHLPKSHTSVPFTDDACAAAWDSHVDAPTPAMQATSRDLWIAQCHQDSKIQSELGNSNAPVDQP
jgi:hypothetical protein